MEDLALSSVVVVSRYFILKLLRLLWLLLSSALLRRCTCWCCCRRFYRCSRWCCRRRSVVDVVVDAIVGASVAVVVRGCRRWAPLSRLPPLGFRRRGCCRWFQPRQGRRWSFSAVVVAGSLELQSSWLLSLSFRCRGCRCWSQLCRLSSLELPLSWLSSLVSVVVVVVAAVVSSLSLQSFW